MTHSEENYLKTIYHLGRSGSSMVSTNAIAEQLCTKASSVTDMLKKLAEKKLVNYKPYKGVRLTDNGQNAAITVIRKHRLWESFLVEKLNFSWDEVHEVAEQLEHIQSQKLTNNLEAFLEFPTHDPHGDPIPDRSGHIHKSEKMILAEVEPGSDCTCVGVVDSGAEFLKFLDKYKINIETTIHVESKEPFDDSMTIRVNNTKRTISNKISTNLYVRLKQ
ncbi:MAG: metal-dependent transcriptional regulator [Flavobacteriaceae bacterium]|nr:metal-dependent transcriptional regulator [Bacteroidia bacterium]MBT8288318.1 metal-dependent transcriptional regulator [Bacteroidia bacterium]NNF75106.1 metal-dependent transcriptional regulator [Flavobacteriaceae bacterium]NNK73814.1 metal-dependent transcriptional regulator [Flavobacteriaceae bacterium]